MSADPITGREPALGSPSDLTGREPFLGGIGSLAALLNGLADVDDVPSDVLVGRMAGAIPQLAPYLDGDDLRLRRAAVRMIGVVAVSHPPTRDQTIPLLIKIIDDSIKMLDWQTGIMAIVYMGGTADRRAADRLVALAVARDSFQFDRPLTLSIGRLGLVALPALLEHVLEGPQPVRANLAAALREVYTSAPEAVPVVRQWLLPLVLDSLGEDANPVNALLTWLSPDFMVEPLLAVVNDKTRAIDQRARVLYRLPRRYDQQFTAAMFDLVRGGEPRLRHIAAALLAYIRIRRDIPRILALIEHPDPEIRRCGIRIAGKRRIKASLPLVVRALGEPKAAHRREAVLALRRIRDVRGVDALVPMLDDRSSVVRRETLTALVVCAWHFPDRFSQIAAVVRKVSETHPDPRLRGQAQRYLEFHEFRTR